MDDIKDKVDEIFQSYEYAVAGLISSAFIDGCYHSGHITADEVADLLLYIAEK